MSFGFYSNQKLKEINPPSAKPFRIPSAVRKGASARLLEPLASAEPFRSVFSPHYTIGPSAGRVVVFARPVLGSQNVSGERTNWGMHDNPVLKSLSLNSCYRFVFFLSFFQGICMLYLTTTLVLMLALVLVQIPHPNPPKPSQTHPFPLLLFGKKASQAYLQGRHGILQGRNGILQGRHGMLQGRHGILQGRHGILQSGMAYCRAGMAYCRAGMA